MFSYGKPDFGFDPGCWRVKSPSRPGLFFCLRLSYFSFKKINTLNLKKPREMSVNKVFLKY